MRPVASIPFSGDLSAGMRRRARKITSDLGKSIILSIAGKETDHFQRLNEGLVF